MKERLLNLAEQVTAALLPHFQQPGRKVVSRNTGGDPHFAIDEVAERVVVDVLRTWDISVAYFSEDRGLVQVSPHPQHLLIIDPIDGTRPALAGLESCCFCVAVVPYSQRPLFSEISHAIVYELRTGEYFYAARDDEGIATSRNRTPRLSTVSDPTAMFWSTELTAHPIHRLTEVYGDLIDASVARGGVFVFTSTSYSLTRIVTGQFDCHIDVGHRILSEHRGFMPEFLHTGRGKVVTLFPYDIAAAAFVLAKSGGVVTDAYGRCLDDLLLITDKSLEQQCSIVAAANPALHRRVMEGLNWKALGTYKGKR
jgi:myo-inositol-1(or 4)-monophosphatase